MTKQPKERSLLALIFTENHNPYLWIIFHKKTLKERAGIIYWPFKWRYMFKLNLWTWIMFPSNPNSNPSFFFLTTRKAYRNYCSFTLHATEFFHNSRPTRIHSSRSYIIHLLIISGGSLLTKVGLSTEGVCLLRGSAHWGGGLPAHGIVGSQFTAEGKMWKMMIYSYLYNTCLAI